MSTPQSQDYINKFVIIALFSTIIKIFTIIYSKLDVSTFSSPKINAYFYVTIFLDGKPNCGGTIISEKHILSAAHCFTEIKNTSRVNIYLNREYNPNKKYQEMMENSLENPKSFENKFKPDFTTFGRNILSHPNYNNFNIENDVAVISLYGQDRFKNSEYFQKLGLSKNPENYIASLPHSASETLSKSFPNHESETELYKLKFRVIGNGRINNREGYDANYYKYLYSGSSSSSKPDKELGLNELSKKMFGDVKYEENFKKNEYDYIKQILWLVRCCV